MIKKDRGYIKVYGVCKNNIPIRDSDVTIEKRIVSLGIERNSTFVGISNLLKSVFGREI